MKKIKQYTTCFLLLFFVLKHDNVFAQNNRENTYGKIGWYNVFATVKFTEKTAYNIEYQWRRDEFITKWQQGLFRFGLSYQLNPRVQFRLGYAWAETFPYGEIPINSFGKDFTEHRIFQMLQLSHKENILDISHRIMLEQRFVGKYLSKDLDTEQEFPLLNRMRYMLRFQAPLKGKTIQNKTPYLALYNEVFIGFGKNVNANIFDQNRIGALFGYRFNKNFRLEAGYLNQIVQFGRQINGKNIFQYNNGLILNAHFNIDFSKEK